MSAEKVIAGYLRVAAEDLRGARLLAQDGNRNAVYLCSQAAEKVIRAVLTSEDKHGGISHNLDIMVDMIPDENPIKPLLREIERLGDYAATFWSDDVTRSGYSEPVATVPAHWQRGLGKSLLTEGLRRLQRMGATTALAGGYSLAANALYRSVMGPDHALYEPWVKEW